MVTTKGTSLNPNAKVWQEIPAQQNDVSSGLEESSSWMQAYSSPAEMTEGSTDGSSPDTKGYYSDYLDSTGDFSAVLPCTMQNVEQPGLGYLLFDAQSNSATDIEVCKEQIVTEESLRDTLKERLEFCFSRENLSKDLYLISQMDNDQFVPIWTVACMEDIQALTTDMDLILDVLKASPLVQVDEAGEKVRPNHSRCIIILREVPETTPLEEVEALFKNENCPKVLSAEFAHNSSWYITFQSDMDALKAYRYLREEVKTFQGKPVMARIKAINTFFGKNGFRSVDSGVYQQHTQQQAQFASPVYMQQVYSSQQQYPVYPVVSPTWSPPIVPHFETPLATFPNDGFMNGYSNNGSYKGNSSSVGGPRSTGRNRNHLKGPSRPEDVTPATAAPAAVINCISGPLSSQDLSSSKTPSVAASQYGSLSPFDLKATSSLASISSRDRMGRDRRSNHRGNRRKREDEQTLKPVPLMEVKAPPPNFDLAASSFPPLPGSVVAVHGEAVAEVRLSDVVRGLKTSTKTGIKEDKSSQNTKDSESHGNTQDPVSLEAKPTPVTVQTEAPQASSTITPAVKEDKPEPPKEEISTSTQPESAAASKQSPTTSNQSVSENPVLSSPTSEQAQRKLSYAEVCQKPAKDLPPAPPATSDNQPLQELKVNTVEEVRPTLRQAPEKSGDKRPPRQPSRAFRGPPGHTRARGYGMKMRENQRGKWFSSQQGGKHSGKEQNTPPPHLTKITDKTFKTTSNQIYMRVNI